MLANLEKSVVATGLEKVSFHSNPKERNAKECSNDRTLHSSHMLVKSCSKFSKPGFNSMWTMKLKMFKLDLEKAEEPEIKLLTPLDHRESKRVPENSLFLLYWLCQSPWLCGLQQTVESSSRHVNSRPPDPPAEKSVCRSRSNSENWTWNNRLAPNRERSISRLYIVTLLI